VFCILNYLLINISVLRIKNKRQKIEIKIQTNMTN
jgi:hypothetical protein